MRALSALRDLLAGEDCNPEWEFCCRRFVDQHGAEILRALEHAEGLQDAPAIARAALAKVQP